MKKIISVLLCAVMLVLCCSCSKKVDYAKLLPELPWDNYDSSISIVFEKSGVCTVSNAISMEKCTYAVDGDTLTITGAASAWTGKIVENEIYIDGMRGFFMQMKERSFYPSSEKYDYIIKNQDSTEPPEDIVYDLTFWYGVYENPKLKATVSLGSSEIPNTLTYVVMIEGGNQTNGTIKPEVDNRFQLANYDFTITHTETGVILSGASGLYDEFNGTYTKVKTDK